MKPQTWPQDWDILRLRERLRRLPNFLIRPTLSLSLKSSATGKGVPIMVRPCLRHSTPSTPISPQTRAAADAPEYLLRWELSRRWGTAGLSRRLRSRTARRARGRRRRVLASMTWSRAFPLNLSSSADGRRIETLYEARQLVVGLPKRNWANDIGSTRWNA